MTPIECSLVFYLDPKILAAKPLVTLPGIYHYFEDYCDSFTYLAYASSLRERFIRKLDFTLDAGCLTGVWITSAVLSIKIASTRFEPDFTDILEQFDLDRLISPRRMNTMERYFLRHIQHDVNVSKNEIKALLKSRRYCDLEIFSLPYEAIEIPLSIFVEKIPDGEFLDRLVLDMAVVSENLVDRLGLDLEEPRYGVELAVLCSVASDVLNISLRSLYDLFDLDKEISINHYFRLMARYRRLQITQISTLN